VGGYSFLVCLGLFDAEFDWLVIGVLVLHLYEEMDKLVIGW